jgi:predicted DCC family thiol-disulfide oxidoreductase YuxK
MSVAIPNIHMPAGPIIVFDGACVLCSANAQFVLRFDNARIFKLAAMQGPIGRALFEKFGIDPSDPDTIIVADGDQVWRNSDAVLAIYGGLGWPWRAFTVFKLIPRCLRDAIYRVIATNRYRIFGKRDTCWVPTAKDRDRVL